MAEDESTLGRIFFFRLLTSYNRMVWLKDMKLRLKRRAISFSNLEPTVFYKGKKNLYILLFFVVVVFFCGTPDKKENPAP